MLLVNNTINSINLALQLKKSQLILTKVNTLLFKILDTFQKLHIIESYIFNSTTNICKINLILDSNIKYIKCISTPNHLIYYSLADIIKLRSLDPFNDYIFSINKSNMNIENIDQLIINNIGGLLLFKIIK